MAIANNYTTNWLDHRFLDRAPMLEFACRATNVCFGRAWLIPTLSPRSLDRQALREITRLIDVRALQHRHMVGEELQRNGEDDGGLQRCRRRRHLDDRHSLLTVHSRLGVREHE